MITVQELLKYESECRKSQKWCIFSGPVMNDRAVVIRVQLKSFGMYNQILRIGDVTTNRASGHTIDKVKAMHKFIADTINDAR